MERITRAGISLSLLLAFAGCNGGGESDFGTVDSGPESTLDVDMDNSAARDEGIPSDEEAMAYVADAILTSLGGAPPTQTASRWDALGDALASKAFADNNESDWCANPAAADVPSWVHVYENGPTGEFGAGCQTFNANTNSSYCQNPGGQRTSGSNKAKWVETDGVTVTCSWGRDYQVTFDGPVLRVGNSGNHRAYGNFSWVNLSNNRSGTSDCTTMIHQQNNDGEYHGNGTCSNYPSVLQLHHAGSCWTVNSPD